MQSLFRVFCFVLLLVNEESNEDSNEIERDGRHLRTDGRDYVCRARGEANDHNTVGLNLNCIHFTILLTWPPTIV